MNTNQPGMGFESGRLKIGHMTYINSEVFYRTLPKDSCELVAMSPRAMAVAVELGELHGGPLPIAEVIRLGDQVRSLGNIGVASDGPAQSVFLFSHLPVSELNGKRVAVTSHTATSIQLLRVLFAYLWKVTGHEFVETSDRYEAALWIGDPALERRLSGEYKYRYDLGLAWQTLTGLPFVFAEWVIRTDVSIDKSDRLERLLIAATSEGMNSTLEIGIDRSNSFMSESDVAEYVSNFTYFLGPKERQGEEEFQLRLSTLPIWRPPTPTIEPPAVPTNNEVIPTL
jgi:chorismate dehydratase